MVKGKQENEVFFKKRYKIAKKDINLYANSFRIK